MHTKFVFVIQLRERCQRHAYGKNLQYNCPNLVILVFLLLIVSYSFFQTLPGPSSYGRFIYSRMQFGSTFFALRLPKDYLMYAYEQYCFKSGQF